MNKVVKNGMKIDLHIHSNYSAHKDGKKVKNNTIKNINILINNLDKQGVNICWTVYPFEDKLDENDSFPFTYAKCLPTFRGLVMAMTDNLRLKRVNSFFNVDKANLNSIEIISNDEKIEIPLSKGINVIIGDNSVGKSMLLHSLTGFSKISSNKSLVKGYKNYLKNSHLNIKKQLNENDIFYFDMQGEVRQKFEENTLNTTEFLNAYFPKDIDPSPYITILKNEVDRLISYLEKKFSFQQKTKKLNSFNISVSDGPSQSLSFIKNLRYLSIIPFYSFGGWRLNGKAVSSITADNDIILKAEYIYTADTCKVISGSDSVLINSQYNPSGYNAAYDEKIYVKSTGGKQLAMYNKSGDFISYIKNTGYISAPKASAIVIKEVDEVKPSTAVTGAFFIDLDGNEDKVSFNCQFFLPEGYKLIECGAVLTGNKATAENPQAFVIGGQKTLKAISQSQSENNEYTISLITDYSGKDAFYGRSYLIYTDENGNRQIIYGSSFKISISKGV